MLERCPFCDGEAIEIIDFNINQMEIEIHCSNCGCRMEDSISTEKNFLNSNTLFSFVREFEAKWNKRLVHTS